MRASAGVEKDDHVSTEGVLHVPVRLADARLPIHPRFSQQLAQNPAIDVAAPVMTDVDDETLTVEDGIVFFFPLIDIVGAHGSQMHVPNLARAGLLYRLPAR